MHEMYVNYFTTAKKVKWPVQVVSYFHTALYNIFQFFLLSFMIVFSTKQTFIILVNRKCAELSKLYASRHKRFYLSK